MRTAGAPLRTHIRYAPPQPRVAVHAVPAPHARPRPAEWILNASLAVLILIVLSPVLLLIAVAVRATSPGPVLYTQTRVGLDRRKRDGTKVLGDRRREDLGGKPFTIYKFRTMYTGAERHTGETWATPEDPRVTSVGWFLRQYRLDELPQLVNVIRGEMNIVGPRPERPGIFAVLREGITGYPLRQRVKPGLTGLAQVSHHYDTCLDDVKRKVSYDLEYIERRCLQEDLRIMARTIPVIFFRRGAW